MVKLVEGCMPQYSMQMQCQEQAEEQVILFHQKCVSGSVKNCENSYTNPKLSSLGASLPLLPPFPSHPPLQLCDLESGNEALLEGVFNWFTLATLHVVLF